MEIKKSLQESNDKILEIQKITQEIKNHTK